MNPRQAEKLRLALGAKGVPTGAGGVMVGSTERFQGQEKRVVLISTVRSDPSFFAFDERHNVGRRPA